MKRVVSQLAVHYFGTAAERPDQCSIHPVLQFFFSTLFVCFYHVIMLQLSGYIFLYRGISKTLRIRRYLQISSINICLVFTYCTYIHMSYTIFKVPQSLITVSIKWFKSHILVCILYTDQMCTNVSLSDSCYICTLRLSPF